MILEEWVDECRRWSGSRRFRTSLIGLCGGALVVWLAPGHMATKLDLRWSLPHTSRGLYERGLDRAAAPVLLDDDQGAGLGVLAQSSPGLVDSVELYWGDRAAPTLGSSLRLLETGLACLSFGVSDGHLWTVFADGTVVVASVENHTLTHRWRRSLESMDDAAAAIAGDRLVVAVSGRERYLASFGLADGDVKWTSHKEQKEEEEDFGPLTRPGDVWEAESRFWWHGRKHVPADVKPVAAWASRHDTLLVAGAELTLRSEFGLEIFDLDGRRTFSMPVPLGTLIADFDADGALDGTKVVDAGSKASPQARLTERRGGTLGPCTALAVRGAPKPIENLFEVPLCLNRDRHERDNNKKRKRGSSGGRYDQVHAANPVGIARKDRRGSASKELTGQATTADDGKAAEGRMDVLYSVSRGVVTRVDAQGEHVWQARGLPTWSRAGDGHIGLTEDGSMVVATGVNSIALLDASDGAFLTELQLPLTWDDESIVAPPVVRGKTVIVLTQFATYSLKIKQRVHGRHISRIALASLIVVVAAIVALVVAFEDY